jgi:hypothetical protein
LSCKKESDIVIVRQNVSVVEAVVNGCTLHECVKKRHKAPNRRCAATSTRIRSLTYVLPRYPPKSKSGCSPKPRLIALAPKTTSIARTLEQKDRIAGWSLYMTAAWRLTNDLGFNFGYVWVSVLRYVEVQPCRDNAECVLPYDIPLNGAIFD